MTREDRTSTAGFAYAFCAAFAVALLLRLWLASTAGLDSDESWHVYTAKLAGWPAFARELRDHAHPPLFFLVLKGVLALHQSPLVERMLSIVCSLATLWVFGRAALKLGLRTPSVLVGMLALGTSYSYAMISIEIRQYALAYLWMCTAFLLAIDSLVLRAPPRIGPLLALHACLLLAALSHYSVGLFIGALAAVPAALAVLDRGYRHALAVRLGEKHFRLGLVAAVVVSGLALGVTAWLLDEASQPLPYLARFLFDPQTESVAAFVTRVIPLEWAVLLPFRIERPGLAVALGAAFTLAALGAALLRWRAAEGPEGRARAALPFLMFGAMLAGALLLSLVRGYPFGGAARHQTILLPFLILNLCLVLDVVHERLAAAPVGRWAVTAGVLIAMAGSSWVQLAHSQRLRRDFRGLATELLDHESRSDVPTYAFTWAFLMAYSRFRDWDVSAERFPDRSDRVVLSKGGDSRVFYRNRLWTLPVQRRVAVLRLVADVARRENARAVDLFYLDPALTAGPGRDLLIAAARQSGLDVAFLGETPEGGLLRLTVAGRSTPSLPAK